MKMYSILFALGFTFAVGTAGAAAPPVKPNVLFIAIDEPLSLVAAGLVLTPPRAP